MKLESILRYISLNKFSLDELGRMINEYAATKSDEAVAKYRNKISGVNSRLRKFRDRDFDERFNKIISDLDDKSFQNKLKLREIHYKEAKRRSRAKKKTSTSNL